MPLDEALLLIDQGEITDSKTVAGVLRVSRRLEEKIKKPPRRKKKIPSG